MSGYKFTEKSSASVYFLIIVLPFLLFYWTIPFLSETTIGNDYIKFAISHQMELLFSMKTGSVPLYVPGFTSGHSSAALTLGQFFHPVTHMASLMPGYWDGKAIEWNTFFKLLSLGFTHLVLYLFLRKIRLNPVFSFLLSLITVYNMRLLDLFRHGAPVEAYTGHLMLCALIGWYFIDPVKWLGPLCIIGTTYLLACSGHPEEMYYGLLGAGIFVIAAPFILSDLLPEKQVDFGIAFRFWSKTGLYLFLGLTLSSIYILPFYYDFISLNVDRVNRGYSWANMHLDTVAGTFSNFLLPLRSQANSAFGGSSLIIVPAILPLLKIFRIKIPRSIWAVWGILVLVFLHMQGSRIPVHRFVWQYFPFASSIRDPGRISIIMPFLMMILLAWIIKAEAVTGGKNRLFGSLKPLTILSFTATLLLIIYCLFFVLGEYMPFFPWSSFAHGELLIIVSGATALLALASYGQRNNSGGLLGLFLIAVSILQIGAVLKNGAGSWIERKSDSPTFREMKLQKKTRLDYLYYPGYGLQSSIINEQLINSFAEPFLGKIFTEVIPVNSQDEAYKRMRQGRLPQQGFVDGYNTVDALRLSKGAKNMTNGNIKLTYSSYNKLLFNVHSEAPAMFGLSYPYTKNWEAWLNGKKVRIYPVNGAAQGIEINAGDNVIEFRYWSDAFFWGMIISCVTFVLIGCFVAFRALKGLSMVAGIIFVFVIAAGVFGVWYNSLYNGDNLETEYIWSYAPSLKAPNLAYGKRNWLGASTISSSLGARERELYIGRFVDGDRSQGSGFATRLSESPAWFLDLSREEDIKTMLLYKSIENPKLSVGPLNMLERICLSSVRSPRSSLPDESPMIIELSNDGNKWSSPIPVEFRPNGSAPARIVFEKPVSARYIKIMTLGRGQLSFDELEIYN